MCCLVSEGSARSFSDDCDAGAELSQPFRLAVAPNAVDAAPAVDQILDARPVENHSATRIAVGSEAGARNRVAKNQIARGLSDRVIGGERITFHANPEVTAEHEIRVDPAAPGVIRPEVLIAPVGTRGKAIGTEKVEVPLASAIPFLGRLIGGLLLHLLVAGLNRSRVAGGSEER